MNRNKQAHLVHAMATYICAEAVKKNAILVNVNIDDLAQMLGAPCDLKDRAYLKAREIIRDFY